MCGKETSGLTMAEPTLYRDKVFVLSPLPRTSPAALALAQSLVLAIGARPLILDPERHDRLVAAISHLPYLLAVTLVNAAEAMAQGDALAWKLAASGFRDTSRVAAGDLTMMLDILATNRKPILEALHHAQAQLAALTRYLEENDDSHLQAALAAARSRRLEMHLMNLTLHPAFPLRGETHVPGDKSITHRALLLSALADGPSRITDSLDGGDCRATIGCLRALGVDVEQRGARELLVHGVGLRGWREPDKCWIVSAPARRCACWRGCSRGSASSACSAARPSCAAGLWSASSRRFARWARRSADGRRGGCLR